MVIPHYSLNFLTNLRVCMLKVLILFVKAQKKLYIINFKDIVLAYLKMIKHVKQHNNPICIGFFKLLEV